jgi:hypothetical protein
MCTFVIHAPSSKAKKPDHASFKGVMGSGIGCGYAIYKSLVPKIIPGCRVVLLDKDNEQRAEGTLIKLEDTGYKTRNHIRQYDVHIRDLKEVKWDSKPESLRKTGIAFIDCK